MIPFSFNPLPTSKSQELLVLHSKQLSNCPLYTFLAATTLA